jgi:hypothetical protein
MKRVHVLEFHDLAWFPSWLRTSLTNILVVFGRAIGMTKVLADLIGRVLEEEKIDRIVDLGSGGGGAMPELLDLVRAEHETSDVSLIMTDLFPNLDAVEIFNQDETPHVRYLREPVDAMDLASAPTGLKTMINCFHHMRPENARSILKSAQDNRQPLLIYELGDNKIPFPVWCIALPIGLPIVFLTALLFTPFVRPLGFRQLFFTYLVPIIPAFYAWDGQASMPRIYGFDDMDELLQGMAVPDYRWEKGFGKNAKGKNQGIYLLGRPC